MKNLFLIIFVLSLGLYGKNPHKIASISEASGISYCKDSNTLMVVDDEGSLYEIKLDGEVVSLHRIGDYDLEGVVCEPNRVILVVEDGYLLNFDRKLFRLKKIKITGKNFKFDKKSGIEGISRVGREYYLTIQSKKHKSKANFLVVNIGREYAKIKRVINHKIIDSAGMEYSKGRLYIVSDKKDKLYIYNIKTKSIEKKVKLDKFDQEGITFDGKGNVYFADDKGRVFKYSEKELGLSI